MNNSNRFFNRSYDNRKTNKEGIPLERFLEKRKLPLNEWLQQNKIYSVVDAEEKVKSMGICITRQSLTELVNYFETPAEIIKEENPQTAEKPKRKKSLEEPPTASS